MLWQARLREYVGGARERSWGGPSRFGRPGLLARRALRRGLRPVLVREADFQRLTERAMDERAREARLWALASDHPVAVDAVAAETDVGSLLLHAHDRVMTPLIRRDGHWEQDEGKWLRETLRRGDTFVDCGANVGYFSLLGSQVVGSEGSVVAVEPEAGNLRLLRGNLWLNGCDNVWVVPAAAADGRGMVALRRSATNWGDHQIHPEASADDVLVPCLPLDEVLDGLRVDAVKIDTQGADHLVVAGLQRTFAANPHAPALIELWLDALVERGVRAADVLTDYRALGRPLGLLGPGGKVTPADDAAILSAAEAAQDHWVNLVLGPYGSSAGS
jgi:FkbM family methyltransferase